VEDSLAVINGDDLLLHLLVLCILHGEDTLVMALELLDCNQKLLFVEFNLTIQSVDFFCENVDAHERDSFLDFGCDFQETLGLPLPVDLSCDVEVVKNFVVDFFEALGF
jgi:hypothetical protein